MANDIELLTTAAEFFEGLETLGAIDQTSLAQAIRRAVAELELSANIEAALADDSPVSPEESLVINDMWERFKASLPVAKVINDNQPGEQAIVHILRDPPTLPVGTLLFTSLQGAKDNAMTLELLEAQS